MEEDVVPRRKEDEREGERAQNTGFLTWKRAKKGSDKKSLISSTELVGLVDPIADKGKKYEMLNNTLLPGKKSVFNRA
jgi:hypothetical protein